MAVGEKSVCSCISNVRAHGRKISHGRFNLHQQASDSDAEGAFKEADTLSLRAVSMEKLKKIDQALRLRGEAKRYRRMHLDGEVGLG